MRRTELLDWLIGAVAGLFLVLLALACVSYWESPCFWDHFEPHVACVAHRVWSGRPIYHDLDAADRYSTVLGPNTHLWNALWQGPNPRTIPGAKTPGIVALGLALAVLAAALARRFGALAALIGCGVVAMAGLMFHQFSYWNRSDPLLLLFMALGVASALFVAEWLRQRRALPTWILVAAFVFAAGGLALEQWRQCARPRPKWRTAA